jgi:predicted nucleotidyltransferase
MMARAPGQSPLVLLDVVSVLGAQEVDYMVIGAMAAAVYGAIRASVDADVLVSIRPQKLPGLEKALRKAGFTTGLRRGDADDPIPALLAVTDAHDNRVDLLCGLRGLDPEAFTRTSMVSFQRTPLRFAGREDFIAMKCYAAGPQDLIDAHDILAAADARIDIELLRRITRRFGRDASDQLERLLAAGSTAVP